jgi:predicted nuclease of predicted toxin-antitoxin system
VRILLDECIDQRFARDLEDHDVSHVRALGWASLGDGALLRRASQEFEVFLTVDRGIAFQQNLSGVSVAIIVLRVKRNTRAHLRPLVPELLRTLEFASAGSVTWLPARPE